ncbi:hypothetical protein ACFV27_07170 [Streptomyces antimycoticus]|uniref:hypothetical protein n=1 Tax=Streptomyces antimycoticus TaxID=68175 RepID=UPI003695A7A3
MVAGTGMIAIQEAITPLGRMATPEEAAAAADWLCSDAAAYVTEIRLTGTLQLTGPVRCVGHGCFAAHTGAHRLTGDRRQSCAVGPSVRC